MFPRLNRAALLGFRSYIPRTSFAPSAFRQEITVPSAVRCRHDSHTGATSNRSPHTSIEGRLPNRQHSGATQLNDEEYTFIADLYFGCVHEAAENAHRWGAGISHDFVVRRLSLVA